MIVRAYYMGGGPLDGQTVIQSKLRDKVLYPADIPLSLDDDPEPQAIYTRWLVMLDDPPEGDPRQMYGIYTYRGECP